MVKGEDHRSRITHCKSLTFEFYFCSLLLCLPAYTSKDPVAYKHWLNRKCSCGWWVCHGFSKHLGINQSTEQTNTLTLWWKNKVITPRWLQFFPEGKNKQKQLTSPPLHKYKKTNQGYTLGPKYAKYAQNILGYQFHSC